MTAFAAAEQSESTAFEALYAAMRAQARRHLRNERNAPSMSPTILVHEAWVALAKTEAPAVSDESHYVRLVGRVMKNLLIDYARTRKAAINGGTMERVEWDDAAMGYHNNSELILAVGDALDKLAVFSPSMATLVELRYFGGFTEDEVARMMGISGRSVRRQWNLARLRLLEIMQPVRCLDVVVQ